MIGRLGCPDDRHLGSGLTRAHFLLNKTANKAAKKPWDTKTREPEWINTGGCQIQRMEMILHAGMSYNKSKLFCKFNSQPKLHNCWTDTRGMNSPCPWGGPGSAGVFGEEQVWHHPGEETGRGQRVLLGTTSPSRWRQNCWTLLLGAPRNDPALGRHPSHRTAPCPERKGRKTIFVLLHLGSHVYPQYNLIQG